MTTRPKIFDDLAGMAGGAFSALSGLGEEIEQLIRARVDEALQRLKLVRRDEFDAVSELAANARAQGEDTGARLATLEARVAALEVSARSAPTGGATPATPSESDADRHLDAEGGPGGPPAHAPD